MRWFADWSSYPGLASLDVGGYRRKTLAGRKASFSLSKGFLGEV
jgi:hypothetical protein